MGAAERIAFAVLSILIVLVAPFVRVSSEYYDETVTTTYSIINTIGVFVVFGDQITSYDIGDLYSELRDAEEAKNLPVSVNLLAYFLLLLIGSFFLIPWGTIVAFFSRAGFGMIIGGLLSFLLILRAFYDTPFSVQPDIGYFLLWIVAILGLIFGKSRKDTTHTKKK
ncbi:hypothetical protein PFDSM3638_03120 [Pyrococcus furiosus DSM 3638]|uniref:Uncharacterized protein n=3 Tax=Pyrococcus furiosus TaxID=2261 RepID=A0A5C0XN52_PYRFU|nr:MULTISPECIES: hypothetical protein [Pyrococcus]AAL80747.1 hypothetical protein PF0623 [Pyrococcus furiosus DSM 3638]AFN03415.1 hypothetical protein PFC_02250 [Pyrococcus furiosus COM1]MDK2869623.1 hypothetical protein [Pyrococcus sp.]QEK78327.1 hypothetical protein PFDSM3638_03120 [Pyrococcus furiosus DSM 3638]